MWEEKREREMRLERRIYTPGKYCSPRLYVKSDEESYQRVSKVRKEEH